MKRYLPALLLIPILLTGCRKLLEAPEDKLEGRWRLAYVERQRLFNETTIQTGYEGGSFYFYNNGQAEFVDGFGTMRGNWRIRYVSSGYYDADGNYQSDGHQVFTLYLADFQNNQLLSWDFDHSYFNGRNRFTATYSSAGYNYRYVFHRE